MGPRKSQDERRHVLVDTEGILLCVVVHLANLPDRSGGRLVLEAVGNTLSRLERMWADRGYTDSLQRWVVYSHWRQLKRSAPYLLPALGYASGFQMLSRRWIVERTFSWIGRYRRMSKDDERLASTAEVFIYLVGNWLLLARLAPR